MEAARKPDPDYEINIEGQLYLWNEKTITIPQIRELAGFDASQPLVEVDLKDNSERTLAEDEVITLEPGKGYGKKVKFQRG